MSDKTSEKFYSRHKEGSETEKMYGSVAFVNHYREFPKDIILSTDKDEKTTKVSGSFDVENTIDSEGNDVLYLKNFKGMGPGHYYLKQLHDLDLTKGDLSNFEFDLNPSGKSVYRTAKVTSEPKEETKQTATSPIVEKYIESLKGEITPEGKLVYTLKSKEQLDKEIPATLTLFNDKTGNSTTHITLYTKDGKNFTGDYAVENLENGVWKPYELSFTDSKRMPQILKRQDLLSYDKQSQVFNGVSSEEPIGSPQLQGKKIGVFANYKKVKKGTVVKYTIKAIDKELKDDSILLVRNGDVYFDHNASRFTREYDSNGNRVIYIRTENLEPGIYNVISIDGKDKTKLEDIYAEDGWFEVGNEDVRREGPAVWDTVPTTKPNETPKESETPKPGKEDTPKSSSTPEQTKAEGDINKGNSSSSFTPEQKEKENSLVAKVENNKKVEKGLPNTGLQTTSYGLLATIIGLFATIGLRRKNK